MLHMLMGVFRQSVQMYRYAKEVCVLLYAVTLIILPVHIKLGKRTTPPVITLLFTIPVIATPMIATLPPLT